MAPKPKPKPTDSALSANPQAAPTPITSSETATSQHGEATVAASVADDATPLSGESQTAIIDPDRLSAADAVGVGYDAVFAYSEYDDHFIVVTVAGQKLRGDK